MIKLKIHANFWPGSVLVHHFRRKIVKLRYELIKEELSELNKAIEDKNIEEVADALTDILYVTYGAGHAFELILIGVLKRFKIRI